MKQVKLSDLDDLALGATILGSGGGGDPVYDLMMAKRQLQLTGPITLVDVENIGDDDIVVPVEFMGAPSVSIEKISNGNEFEAILAEVKKTYKRNVSYLLATEIGGANAFPPILVSARLGIPVIDGDTLGRAFPELQITSCNVKGISASPAFICDALGNVQVVYAADALEMERRCRQITMEMGSCAALSLYIMTGKQAKEGIIRKSVSKAIQWGKSIREAKEAGAEPLAAFLEYSGGRFLGQGVIEDIDQSIQKGFLQGSVTISLERRILKIAFQNEYLIAYDNGIPCAATPDIITLFEADTCTPIPSESLAYGVRAAVVVLPAPGLWKTPEGLALTAPECFGYSLGSLQLEGNRR